MPDPKARNFQLEKTRQRRNVLLCARYVEMTGRAMALTGTTLSD
jgi:hypothetical protein